MFAQLDIFQQAGAMARHAALRQNVIAQNIANADRPGYRARDIAPFADILRDTGGLRRTRAGHVGAPDHPDVRRNMTGGMPSANGNAVSLETEMVNAVAVRQQHDRALAIYRSSLTLLRASIGRR